MSWRLDLGDCTDPAALPSLEDRSVDHVITDPPYSPDVQAKSLRGAVGEETRSGPISAARSFGFAPLTPLLLEIVAIQIARVCRRWALIFSDCESAHVWREAVQRAGMEYVRTMAWVRPGSAPQFSGDRPSPGFEEILLFHARRTPGGRPLRKVWNGGGRAGVYTVPVVQKGDRLHTAQKPFALLEALIRDFTAAGELILDPFAGSATTGVAAVRLGRSFIGFEREERWHGIGSRRLILTREQLELPIVPRRLRRARQLLIQPPANDNRESLAANDNAEPPENQEGAELA